MLVFTVSARTLRSSGGIKQRPTRVLRWWYNFLPRAIGALVFAEIAFLLFKVSLYSLFFLLLPVIISIIWGRSQLTNLIHGTVVYGVLTFGLAFIYFGSITMIQILIHTPGYGVLFLYHGPPVSLFIVVTTTLAWAVILTPLHDYAQARIDQHFNRGDYEAARAIAAFTSTLREEIELDKVRDGLLTVVQQTMQPQLVTVWVRALAQQQVTLSAPATLVKPQTLLPPAGVAANMPYDIAIATSDPIIGYILSHPGIIAIDHLRLSSPVVHILQSAGVEVVLPLVSERELIGLLTLGARGDRQAYTYKDQTLLNTLADQVAPALRVAQLVAAQQAEIRERERIEQELRTAREIQRTFLPKEVPALPGWQIVPYYQSAREVGGDFYDFLTFADGRLGIVIGDVTDKGIPAALVMTATRTMIRTAAQENAAPADVFTRVNDLLYADIPERMFVTCFYALLDPHSGRLRYANAGQDLPFHCHDGDIAELWATGMPLGMLPHSRYEEHEISLEPGASLLFYSDGLAEAHNSRREIFDTARIKTVLTEHAGGAALVAALLGALQRFTGANWEQEDDVTLVTVQRSVSSIAEDASHIVDTWSLPSVAGNERLAMQRVGSLARAAGLSDHRVAHLETAVAEATLNAMEHGNAFQSDQPVTVTVLTSPTLFSVRISDQGSGPTNMPTPVPDITAKLAEQQSPRGWGLFLITQLVDDVRVTTTADQHTVELRMRLTTSSDDTTPTLASEAAPSDSAGESTGRFPQERSTPMPPIVTLSVRSLSPTVAAIDVQGDITAQAEDALTQAYAQATTPTMRAVILNFTGLAYMNSIGIGLLVTLLIRMKRQRQVLLAYGLSDHYRHIFALTRLDEAIILAATEADAVNAANRLAY